MRSAGKKQPKVSIVLLNWNGKADTIECLESLRKIEYQNAEIIVVDNGSSDGSQTYLGKKYPHIQLIKNKENLGFTGGNNVGMRKAMSDGADYVLLLNNDTYVEQNFLTELVAVGERDPSIGIVGPKIYYYSLPDILWSAGGDYIPVIGKTRVFGENKEDKPKYGKQKEVSWVTGCAMLIKRGVIEKIGVLEEEYFSNYEDIDFCFHARNVGFKVWYVPTSVIYHKVAQDWGGLSNPLYLYYQIRNNLLFIKRNLPLPQKILSYCFFYGVSLPRKILALALSGDVAKIQFIFLGISDFLRGKFHKTFYSVTRKKAQKEDLTIALNIRFLQARPLSGIGTYVQELVKNIGKYDKQNKYLFFEEPNKKQIHLLEAQNVRYFSLPKYTKKAFLKIMWEQFLFSSVLRRKKVTVLHGPSFMLPVKKTCSAVITVHDLAFLRYPEAFTWATRMYYRLFFPRSLKNADMIIADSHATKNDIIKEYGLHPNKIKVIHLAVEDEFKRVQEKEALEKIRKKYNLPEKFFLFVGLLSPRKNLVNILKAYERLGVSHHLVLVGGKGWLYEDIFAEIEMLGIREKVHWIGYVEDRMELPAFYTLAEALVFPSFYEGFGFPILEAMACGCPVITSAVSSMPEIAGDAALFVNPHKPEEIENAMRKIIEDKACKNGLIKKGSEQLKKFSWEKTARETIAVYMQLANRSPMLLKAEELIRKQHQEFICPSCKVDMKEEQGEKAGEKSYHCLDCGAVYKKENGICNFLPKNMDEFKKGEATFHSEIVESYHDIAQLDAARNTFAHNDFLEPLRNLKASAKIAELGCGLGQDGRALMKQGFYVVQSDISPKTIEKAKKTAEMEGLTNGEFMLMDSENLPYPDNYFDAMFMVASLHHMMDAEKALREMKRCTKTGGTIIIGIEPNKWQFYWVFPIIRFYKRHIKHVEKFSPGDETTTGFTKKEFLRFARKLDLSIVRITPIWYVNGFVHLGTHGLYRAFKMKKRVKVHPSLEKLVMIIDKVLTKTPYIRNYPWQWNIIMKKKE